MQRVRVAGSIPRLSGKPYRCVKLVREPKEKDWATFFALTRDYMQQNTPVGQDEDFDNDAEGDADEDYQPDDSLKVLVADDENVEDLDVTQIDVPQWSSDRPLVNMLYDIIHASGTNGISIQVFQINQRIIASMTDTTSRVSKTSWLATFSIDHSNINSRA